MASVSGDHVGIEISDDRRSAEFTGEPVSENDPRDIDSPLPHHDRIENLDIVDPLVAGTELELSPCHDRAYLRNRSSQVRLNRRSDGSTARICRSDEGSLGP
ncbi:MAG: hypothetical protein M3Y17_06885 [Actinomycetota bacterium]|nr:hypothetical protein [Actinomycetota bacterium]